MKPHTHSEAYRIATFCAAAAFAQTLLSGCGESEADKREKLIQKQLIEDTKRMEESKKNSFMDKGLPPIVWPDKFSDNFKTPDGKPAPAPAPGTSPVAQQPAAASTSTPSPAAAPASPDATKRAP
jgi:hypothetical protein